MWILTSSGIGAITNFFVLAIIATSLGPGEYSSFSVFWSALFLLIAFFFGLQQETTRAVASAQGRESNNTDKKSLTRFGGLVASLIFFTILLGGFLVVALFGEAPVPGICPLAVGVASYILTATLNGILAGSHRWGLFGLQPILDGTFRLIFVFFVILTGASLVSISWAVTLPIPLSFLILWVTSRRKIRTVRFTNISYPQLLKNSSQTVVATLSMAALVNGMPIVLVFLGRLQPETSGVLILALMLTRAPILLPLNAMQSYLITHFAGAPQKRKSTFFKTVLAIFFGTLVLALVSTFAGEFLIVGAFGPLYSIDGIALGGLVISGGCIGLLTLTGSVVLGANKHRDFALGWMIASAVTVLLLLLVPGDDVSRVILSLIVGPLVGAGYHLIAIRQIIVQPNSR